jgi:hypothetical protein
VVQVYEIFSRSDMEEPGETLRMDQRNVIAVNRKIFAIQAIELGAWLGGSVLHGGLREDSITLFSRS